MKMQFVFWHPTLSIHHAPLLRRLSMMPGVSVTLVARMALEQGRESSGWRVPDYGNTRLIDTAGKDYRTLVPEVIGGVRTEALHLASDAMFNPISRCAWQHCSQQRVPFGFISIYPGMYVGRMGRFLRHALYRTYVRHAARNANPILTISAQCRQFFIDRGFPAEHIFPWAYFVEDCAQPFETMQREGLRLVYLGRLLKRKRVDVLLHALARMIHGRIRVRLTIVGSGPEEQNVQQLVRDLQLEEHVVFNSTISHDDVHCELQKHDVLVLPTECDDWGVVVNEALQAGLAVITTENAGACELIHCGQTGLVCKCNVDEFAAAIAQIIEAPETLAEMRRRARDYAGTISPTSAAHYLRDIAEHVLHRAARPSAPWHIRMSCGEIA
jgi:glycosyltransferase involved in cell wall biosynthesis